MQTLLNGAAGFEVGLQAEAAPETCAVPIDGHGHAGDPNSGTRLEPDPYPR
jgi:hypothetical protein